MTSRPSDPGLRRIARFLGLASLGLGVAQVRSPLVVARLAGVDDSPTAPPVITAVGIRELVHAAGLLPGRPGWAWTRVAGDAMDLTAMGRALANRRGERYRRLRNATAAVVGLTVLDVYTAVRSSRSRAGHAAAGGMPTSAPWKSAVDVTATTTVNKPPQEVYRYWRDLEHLPAFMAHVREVRSLDGGKRSHWVAEAPGRRTIEWDADVVEDQPDRLIRWRSTGDADIQNAGEVQFQPAPGGRGTEVRVHLSYAQPGGRLGKAVATLFGEAPDQQVRDDLARFKQLLETGQIVRSEGTPEGPLASRLLRQRPAVPLP
jgi:uncharacterized membrane protein